MNAVNKELTETLAKLAEQPAPVQETVKWSDYEPDGLHHNKPAQRTWVGLTDGEFQWIYDHGRTPVGMMIMVEAKLKEKNT